MLVSVITTVFYLTALIYVVRWVATTLHHTWRHCWEYSETLGHFQALLWGFLHVCVYAVYTISPLLLTMLLFIPPNTYTTCMIMSCLKKFDLCDDNVTMLSSPEPSRSTFQSSNMIGHINPITPSNPKNPRNPSQSDLSFEKHSSTVVSLGSHLSFNLWRFIRIQSIPHLYTCTLCLF